MTNTPNSRTPPDPPESGTRSPLEASKADLLHENVRLQARIQQLQLDVQRYCVLRATTSDAVYRFNPDGKWLLEMDGKGFTHDTEAPTDRWLEKYFYPEDRTTIGTTVEAGIATNKAFNFEHRFRRLDGTTGWCRSHAKPIFSEDGELIEWLGTVTDLTAYKFAAENLRLATEGANLGIWTLDFFTGRLWWSERLKSMVGLPARREPTLAYFWSIVHPDDLVGAQAIAEKAKETGCAYANEYRIVKPDGADFWVRSIGQTFPAGDPHPRGMCGVMVDIHAQKIAQLALIRSREHLEELVQERTAELEIARKTAESLANRLQVATGAAKLGIWAMSLAEGVMEWDRRMCDIYEFPTYWKNRPVDVDVWKSYLHPDDRRSVEESLKKRLQSRDATEMRYRIVLSGNRVRYIKASAQTQFDGAGRAVSVFGTNEDITEQVILQNELQEAHRTAEAASQVKSKFLAAASHDLRQPLAAISLLLNTLRNTELDVQQSELLRLLEKAQGAQKQMLNTLLDVAKLDAGPVPVKFGLVAVDELFVWIEDAFWMQCREAGLRFDLHYPREKILLHTDLALLKGILRNLIGNALKYCKAGRILVSLRKREGTALIQVWDTGIGIAPENLPSIFDEFYQVGNEERDSAKGLGLGLSIVKRLAKLIGVELNCRSKLGKGSVFEVWVPLPHGVVDLWSGAGNAAKLAATASAIPDGLVGKSVTVIEDNPDVRESMLLALSAVGIRARAFDQAATCLAAPDIGDSDFYISDFRLPGAMNGLSLLSEIERRKGLPIRAVLITGETLDAEYPELKASPWKVMVKPCELTELLAALVA